MEIPSINLEEAKIPSIIGGPMDFPSTPISFTLPDPPFTFPPLILGSPICISGTPFPPISFAPISFTSLPPISISLPPIANIQLEPTTAEKCKLILQKIVELANEGKPIGFEQDFGGWTATITKGKMHSHVGIPGKDGNFDILVNNLYDLLIKGQGLSWV